MNKEIAEMDGVKVYGEPHHDTPALFLEERSGRVCVVAWNQGGHDSTWIDAQQLFEWLDANRDKWR